MNKYLLAIALCLTASLALAEERTLDLGNGNSLRYSVVDSASTLPSARDTATRLLRHLAAGELEQAALLSNAPERRLKVLNDYKKEVGEDEFKRVFSRYLQPENPILAEISIDDRRLIIWTLGEADDQLVGQFYVGVNGQFLMDDVPNQARTNLRRVLCL